MTLESIIAACGYPGVYVGTLLEGEVVLVLAGYLANRGYLRIGWVIAVAFLGAFTADQCVFHLGRRKGAALIARHPAWAFRLERVQRLVRERQTLVILGFRFIYGSRTLAALVLGNSGVSPKKFFVLNMISDIVWAVAVAMLGYVLGAAAQVFLHRFERYEMLGAAGIAGVGCLWWCARLIHRRMRRKRAEAARKA